MLTRFSLLSVCICRYHEYEERQDQPKAAAAKKRHSLFANRSEQAKQDARANK